jgi:hypothetical protein
VTAGTERWRRRLGIERGEERLVVAAAIALFLVGWATISVTNQSVAELRRDHLPRRHNA